MLYINSSSNIQKRFRIGSKYWGFRLDGSNHNKGMMWDITPAVARIKIEYIVADKYHSYVFDRCRSYDGRKEDTFWVLTENGKRTKTLADDDETMRFLKVRLNGTKLWIANMTNVAYGFAVCYGVPFVVNRKDPPVRYRLFDNWKAVVDPDQAISRIYATKANDPRWTHRFLYNTFLLSNKGVEFHNDYVEDVKLEDIQKAAIAEESESVVEKNESKEVTVNVKTDAA